jgi:hypothetical protein
MDDDSVTINSENNRLVNRQDTAPVHTGLLNPRGPYLKWIAVFFMCFLSFGKKNYIDKVNLFYVIFFFVSIRIVLLL